MTSIEDRFAGCLLGLACGDALGGPLEEIPNSPCTIPRPVIDMIGGGWLKLQPGQITDDTEMTLCLARSIVACKKLDYADIAKRYVAWLDDSPIGAGKTCTTAITRIKEGIPWHEAANTELGRNSLGNGAVMRCAPIALYAWTDDRIRAKAGYAESTITHLHHDCYLSTNVVTHIIASLLRGDDKKSAFRKCLLQDWTDLSRTLMSRYARIPTLTDADIKTSGEVKDTVESAIHCLLSTDTLETAIIKAANAGGDADTRAAITGAFAGAHYGASAIPSRWADKLCERHGAPIADELKQLGSALRDAIAI